MAAKDESGTTISFLPDPEVFEETEFTAATLSQRLRETAFLTRGLRIVLRDERAGGKTEEFHYEGGIRDFVAHVNESKDTVHKHVVYFEGENDDGQVEVAMQWNNSYVESVFSFANNINTTEGGAHLSGFKAALTGTLNRYARDKGLLKEKEENLEGEDVREGLAAVISVKLRNPQFEGQTKTKLGNPPDRGPRQDDRQPAARAVPRGEPDRGAADHQRRPSRPRAHVRLRARHASSRAGRARSSRTRCPGKLADCQISDPESAELFLVEGNSAGGSAVDARDRTFQAILPLRGKVINAEKNRINKVLSNEEIQAIITAIGTGIGEEFDIEKLRYHRIIVMTDADVDGAHIRTLILTFLYRQMQELVEGGYVYIAVPPLYRVKIGSQQRYVEKESQFEELLARERIKDMDVTDRRGETQKLTETRYGKLARVLNEFDGWVSRLREDFGHCGRELRRRPPPRRGGRRAPSRAHSPSRDANGYELAVVESNDDETRVKVVERETGAASSVVVPSALLASPIYANVRKTYARLAEIVGQPALRRRLRQEDAACGDVRRAARAGARAREGRHPGQPLQGSRRDGRRGARGHDDGSGEPQSSSASTSRTPPRPTASSRCSWATRSSRAARSSSRTPAM